MLVSYSYKFHSTESNPADFNRIAAENGNPEFFVVTVENDLDYNNAAILLRQDVLSRFDSADSLPGPGGEKLHSSWGYRAALRLRPTCKGLSFEADTDLKKELDGYRVRVLRTKSLAQALELLDSALKFERRNIVKVHLPTKRS